MGLGLADDLVGVLRGVAHQLPACWSASLRSGRPARWPWPRAAPRLSALLGFGHESSSWTGRRPAARLPGARLLPARRDLDLELGFGLGLLCLALLQDPLRPAAHLVGLPLGGGEDLVAVPLGGRLELGHLALGARPQLGDVTLGPGPVLRDLLVRRGPELGHIALGDQGQLVGLAPGRGPDRVRLLLGPPRRSSVSRLAFARSPAASFSAPARSSAASALARP